MKDSHRNLFVASALFYTVLTILSSAIPFFWDNILLGSQFAHHFYDTGFSKLIPPPSVDCGHPLGYGIYLATCWSLFGKTLAVSHWAIWPFLMLLSWYYIKTASYFFEGKWLWLAVLFLWIEPTVLTQCVLATSDVVLLAFTFGAIQAILYRKRKLLLLMILGLAVVSLRGIYWALLLYVIDIFVYLLRDRKIDLVDIAKLILPYLPAAVVTIAYYAYHYHQTGWLVQQTDSIWSHHYGLVWESYYHFKRTQFLLWRFADMGRLFVWIAAGLSMLAFLIRKEKPGQQQVLLLAFFAIPFLLFCMPLIPQKAPIMHRYFMFQYLVLGLLTLAVLTQLRKKWLTRLCIFMMCAGQLSGHLWCYPDRFGMGWDATLGHLPYHSLKEQMLEYLDQEQIYRVDIATAYPLLETGETTDLNGDLRRMIPFRSKKMKEYRYILQSNINNDFHITTLEQIRRQWILEKEFSSYPVYINLWRNPDFVAEGE